MVCICCHGSLLRCVRHSGVYWFCPNCWQEMPNLETSAAASPLRACPEEVIHSFTRSHSGAESYESSTACL